MTRWRVDMTPAASVTNLRLKFPGASGLQFKDLSLSIGQGEKVLFLGPSGCGKSTLLQVLTGLIPNSVEVPVKYDNITIPNAWGFVFQDPDTQFCMPYVDEELAFVLENMQVPRDRMTELIDNYLELVGLRLDDRHTPIQSLSQGMKQRLAIASVLALQPDTLLLDEPTALLDPEGTIQVWETIKSVGQDKTLIIVEHKIDHIIDLVDRIIVFDADGKIIADGPRADIFLMHREEFRRFGIWYPEVWDDYLQERNVATSHAACRNTSPTDVQNADAAVIELQDFKALRGKTCITSVDHCLLHAGKWVTVVGENGAGKSTLLLALMQLIKSSGSYKINGMAVSDIQDLSNMLAFVFQNPEFQFVTNRTWDEIAYTLRLGGHNEDEIKDKVSGLLDQFDLKEQLDLHPYQLSMGQKRRLSVASAIVKEQPILLLDEPTFGQDARSTFAILEKLEAWQARGTTVIMVTHDMRIVRHFATQVWHVEDGGVSIFDEPLMYLQSVEANEQEQSGNQADASQADAPNREQRTKAVTI